MIQPKFTLECWTDGACKGSSGSRGGWGWFAELKKEGECNKENYLKFFGHGGSESTTNNEMELRAMAELLEFCIDMKDTEIIIRSDSQYVVKSLIGEFSTGKQDIYGPLKDITFPISGWLGGWINPLAVKLKVYDPKGMWKDPSRINGEEWFRVFTSIRVMISKGYIIKVGWVRGHKKVRGNEIADKLANVYTDI